MARSIPVHTRPLTLSGVGSDAGGAATDMPAPTPVTSERLRPGVALLHLPVLLVVALACLVAGLTLPIMEVRQFWVFGGSYSILSAILLLLDEGEVITGVILLAFSVCLPAVKILALLGTWWWIRRGRRPSPQLSGLLETLGKWSMLDVLVVALIIFAAKAGALVDATVAGAVIPFTISIALTLYCARRITRSLGQ